MQSAYLNTTVRWRQTITGVRFERTVPMIQDEPELLALVLRLQQAEQAKTDFFADHSLPEYTVVDELDLTATEAARFLTLSLVPFHAHPSGRPKPQIGRVGFWRVCKTLWQQHQWVYDPHRLVTTEGEQELEAFFDRLDIMDAYDAHWWFTSAGTLYERFDGDPQELLRHAAHVAPHAARVVRQADLPGIADAVSTPLWVRLMHDRVASLAGMGWVPLPVDHTLFAVTEALGDLDVDIGNREDRAMVQTFWEVFCEKHGLVPYRVEKSLRVVGLYWHRGGRDYVTSVLEDYASSGGRRYSNPQSRIS